MKEIKFHGDYLATSKLINSIRIDFEKGISNVAKGIIPAKTYKEYIKLDEPFFNLDDKSIQYVGVDDESFKKLENINENPYYITQILIKNDYFLKNCRLPRIIYVYPYPQYCYYMKGFFPENIKYLKLLPSPITIEDNYIVDEKTSRKLDNLADELAKISLNKAIFNIFDGFPYPFNIFNTLYKFLKEQQKNSGYELDKDFLNNILIFSKTYKNSIIFFDKKYFKKMEIFLFLSQKFGYKIPQKYKDNFKNTINPIISNLKSVLSYCDNFEKVLCEAVTDGEIMTLANQIYSSPMSMNKSEYSGVIFSFEHLQDSITDSPTVIGYNYNNNYYDEIDNNYYGYEDNSKLARKEDFLYHLSPLIENKSIIEKLKLDDDFPLYEHRQEGYNERYYRLHNYYNIRSTDSLCYLNLAKFFNQIANSPYPYEFNKQILLSKLPEIMPFISTCFCDIPQLF